jgi:magnesium chelatase family protein
VSINGVAGYVDATAAANRFTWLRWNSELLRKEVHTSAQMFARDITRYCTVNDDAERLLETAINKLGLSAGAYSRVLKAGRTIADLAGTVEIQPAQIAEAIQYRSPDRRL